MRVDLALQVLSHSTYAGMRTLVDLKKLPHSAMQTADFIEKVQEIIYAYSK
jgi:hypothetical protein